MEVLWHTKGADKSIKFLLKFFNSELPTTVAFGEDGKICAVSAHLVQPRLIPSSEVRIRGNLLKEVSSNSIHL